MGLPLSRFWSGDCKTLEPRRCGNVDMSVQSVCETGSSQILCSEVCQRNFRLKGPRRVLRATAFMWCN